jgi:hypothetical protein
VSVQVDLHVSKRSSTDKYWFQTVFVVQKKAAPKGPPFLMPVIVCRQR